MNSRPRLEPKPAATGLQPIPRVRDQRTLVLLLIGLLIVSFHLFHKTFPDLKKKTTDENTLLWLVNSSGNGQVYSVADTLLPPLADNFNSLYESLGLKPPTDDIQAGTDLFPDNQQNGLRGLVVSVATPPAAIPVPALMASFFFKKIPINEADEELLITIPGIGPRLARQLLALREQKDRIQNPAELLEIPGIHYKKLQQITDHLSFR